MRVIQDQRTLLAHWVYTREEWRFFEHWRLKRKGIVLYWLSRIRGRPVLDLPEITVTGHKVWINDRVEIFADDTRKLRRVHLRETDVLHVLEIIYELTGQNTSHMRMIQIPVPRGKLREAIDVQECLSGNAF